MLHYVQRTCFNNIHNSCQGVIPRYVAFEIFSMVGAPVSSMMFHKISVIVNTFNRSREASRCDGENSSDNFYLLAKLKDELRSKWGRTCHGLTVVPDKTFSRTSLITLHSPSWPNNHHLFLSRNS